MLLPNNKVTNADQEYGLNGTCHWEQRRKLKLTNSVACNCFIQLWLLETDIDDPFHRRLRFYTHTYFIYQPKHNSLAQ